MKKKNIWWIISLLGIVVFSFTSCFTNVTTVLPSPAATSTQAPSPIPTPSLTPTQAPSPTPTQTTSPTPIQTPTFTQTTLPTPSQTPSPTPTQTTSPTPVVITEMYDFENQPTALPNSFIAVLGGQNRMPSSTEVWSKYEIDNTVAYSGTKSFKLSSDINTNTWYVIKKQILTNYNSIYISFWVKGNNIRKEGNQVQDCHLGFMFTDSNGKKTFKVSSFMGTFDWIQGELRLSSTELKSIRDSGSQVEFHIFLVNSGEFWVDNLKFEFTPLTP